MAARRALRYPMGIPKAALIWQVCERSGIVPGEIAYFEVHGTGTAVGDPPECNALGSVLNRGRSLGDGCLVGSVKANIGHLEAAVGIAGVIKSVLCLTHRQIPPVANLEDPNPKISFEELRLRLPRKLEPMPEGKQPAYIGINSFSYGSTQCPCHSGKGPGDGEVARGGCLRRPLPIAIFGAQRKGIVRPGSVLPGFPIRNRSTALARYLLFRRRSP